MFSKESANTNYIIFGLTRYGIKTHEHKTTYPVVNHIHVLYVMLKNAVFKIGYDEISIIIRKSCIYNVALFYIYIFKFILLFQFAENMTDSNVVQFKVVRDNQGRKLEVTSANLLVKIKYKRKHPRRLRRRRKLKLKKISLKLSTVDSLGHPVNVVSSITTKIRRTKWLKVPLPAKVIESAMQRIDGNLYLHLNCEGCDKAAQLILINGHRNKIKRKKGRRKNKKLKAKLRELKSIRTRRKRRLNRTRPFLILHTKVKTYIRSKRDAVICKNNSICCMDNLHVDFNSIGWGDWVIAPKSFETGVCQGVCSYNHSSCQETKSKHLVFLYFDENGNVIRTSLPNMILTECGCSHGTSWIHKS